MKNQSKIAALLIVSSFALLASCEKKGSQPNFTNVDVTPMARAFSELTGGGVSI